MIWRKRIEIWLIVQWRVFLPLALGYLLSWGGGIFISVMTRNARHTFCGASWIQLFLTHKRCGSRQAWVSGLVLMTWTWLGWLWSSCGAHPPIMLPQTLSTRCWVTFHRSPSQLGNIRHGGMLLIGFFSSYPVRRSRVWFSLAHSFYMFRKTGLMKHTISWMT